MERPELAWCQCLLEFFSQGSIDVTGAANARGEDLTMATGWAGDGAVQDQIDATIKDAVERVRRGLPKGKSLTHCESCGACIPVARRKAVPGVRLCVPCQEAQDREAVGVAHLYNRRDSKDSQLR
jgi:phage/conjugal plasmid C-4 type zinc finger TraR family protein